MKKVYSSPETQVIALVGADVICTSIDDGQPNENDPGFLSMDKYWHARY